MNEQEIRARIEKRVSQQAEYIIHLLTYVFINPMLWILWATSGSGEGIPWPLVLTLGWTLGLIAHTIQTFRGHFADILNARLLAYIIINPMLWILWVVVSDGGLNGIPWPLFITLGWTLSLLVHATQTFKSRLVDYLTDRELRYPGSYAKLKPKRNGLVSFNDDGELDLPDDEVSYRQTAKHN